jgi:hypothetical protein
LSLAKAFSIGLKSGEYGGRKRSVAPVAVTASRTALPLWAGRLSRITISPGRNVGSVGEEPLGRHRAVEHHRCGHAAEPERADEGSRLPVAVRDRRPQPFSARRSPMQARHLGAGAGLVDEHQRVRVEIELALEPRLASAQDVRPILLGRVPGLFLSVIRRRWKKRHKPATLTPIPRPASSSRRSANVMSDFLCKASRITAA